VADPLAPAERNDHMQHTRKHYMKSGAGAALIVGPDVLGGLVQANHWKKGNNPFPCTRSHSAPFPDSYSA
jgi:hypothetical protein